MDKLEITCKMKRKVKSGICVTHCSLLASFFSASIFLRFSVQCNALIKKRIHRENLKNCNGNETKRETYKWNKKTIRIAAQHNSSFSQWVLVPFFHFDFSILKAVVTWLSLGIFMVANCCLLISFLISAFHTELSLSENSVYTLNGTYLLAKQS